MNKGMILVADDDAAIRTVLNQALSTGRIRSARDLQRGHTLAMGLIG